MFSMERERLLSSQCASGRFFVENFKASEKINSWFGTVPRPANRRAPLKGGNCSCWDDFYFFSPSFLFALEPDRASSVSGRCPRGASPERKEAGGRSCSFPAPSSASSALESGGGGNIGFGTCFGERLALRDKLSKHLFPHPQKETSSAWIIS